MSTPQAAAERVKAGGMGAVYRHRGGYRDLVVTELHEPTRRVWWRSTRGPGLADRHRSLFCDDFLSVYKLKHPKPEGCRDVVALLTLPGADGDGAELEVFQVRYPQENPAGRYLRFPDGTLLRERLDLPSGGDRGAAKTAGLAAAGRRLTTMSLRVVDEGWTPQGNRAFFAPVVVAPVDRELLGDPDSGARTRLEWENRHWRRLRAASEEQREYHGELWLETVAALAPEEIAAERESLILLLACRGLGDLEDRIQQAERYEQVNREWIESDADPARHELVRDAVTQARKNHWSPLGHVPDGDTDPWPLRCRCGAEAKMTQRWPGPCQRCPSRP